MALRNSVVQSFTRRNKPIIDITLNDQQDTYVSSYTTLDKIEGEVSIKAEHDLKFDDISITFEGRLSSS